MESLGIGLTRVYEGPMYALNPMVFNVDVYNLIEVPGERALIEIDMAAGFSIGENITFTDVDGVQHVLTCVLFPDKSGYQYSTIYFVSSDQVLASMSVYFRGNPFLNQNYDIWFNQTPGRITIRAKQIGAKYTLGCSTTDPNLTITTNNPGTDHVMKENYSVKLQPVIERDTVFGQYLPINENTTMQWLRPLYATPSNVQYVDGDMHATVYFDISKLVKPYLKLPTDIFYNFLNGLNWQYLFNSKRFYLEVSEVFGATPVENIVRRFPVPSDTTNGNINPDDYFYAVLGGLSTYDHFQQLNLGSWFDLAQNEMYALTNRPFERQTVLMSPEYINWWNIHGDGEFRVMGSVTMASLDYYIPLELFTFNSGIIHPSVLSIRSDYSIFNSTDYFYDPTLQSRTPLKYTVWVEFNGNDGWVQVVAPITYHVVDADKNDRYFVYQSSMGGIESIVCSSQLQNGVSTTADEFKPMLELLHNYYEHEKTYLNPTHTEYFAASTGIQRSKLDMLAVMDFLHSPKVFEVVKATDAAGDKLMPVVIDRGEYDLINSDDGFWAVNFKYSYAIVNNGFSKVPWV